MNFGKYSHLVLRGFDIISQKLRQVNIYSLFVVLFGYISFFYNYQTLSVVIALLLYIIVFRQKISWSNRQLVLLILAFSAYMVVNSLLLARAYFTIWNVILPNMLFLTIMLMMPTKETNYQFIGYGMIIIAMIVASRGIWWYLNAKKIYWFHMNPNFLGGFLATIFPVALCFMFKAKYWPIRVINFLTTLIIMTAIVMTTCRGSLFAIFGAVLFIMFIHKKYWLLPVYAFYGYIVGILTTDYFDQRVIQPLVTIYSSDTTVLSRLQLWKAGWILFKKNFWFGCGLGNYQFLSLKQGVPITIFRVNEVTSETIHNSYLQILTELGFCGALLFIVIMFLIFYPAFKYLFESKEKDILLTAFVAGSLAFLIQNVTNSLIFIRYESAVAWICMGLTVCRVRYLKGLMAEA